ncbi:sulfite reductase [Acrasis kona]|uniref:Sulfite reductase n=1 Tax=Acrasis kona TaxID=1008807 RepID=A0AAW2ZAX4_9EUKA
MKVYQHGARLHDNIPHPHTSDTVMMVRPVDFAFNEQTATDNEFQNVPTSKPDDINANALREFQQSVEVLQSHGVNVIVLERPTFGEATKRKLPDAVFPNNWISTHRDGNVVLFPMATLNRRDETLRSKEVQKLLHDLGFDIKNVIQIGRDQEDEKFLEGTGSMVIDHVSRTVYAALSVRTNAEQLDNYIEATRYYTKSVTFNTKSSSGLPFYHTNVMMSIGDKFAVVCTECIVDDEVSSGQQVVSTLKNDGKEVIEITLEQAEKYFCGNILQVRSNNGNNVIAMSESCLKGFTKEQLDILQRHGTIAAFPIAPTIEFVGGGSARCMLAEIHLPKRALNKDNQHLTTQWLQSVLSDNASSPGNI